MLLVLVVKQEPASQPQGKIFGLGFPWKTLYRQYTLIELRGGMLILVRIMIRVHVQNRRTFRIQ